MKKFFSPAVSVIIPMYNAEKYLSPCLESLLMQTFTDFEVLLIDDCSNDNSSAIAENYLEKFGGRLKIITLSENTGAPGLPRNIGLEYACGKYVFFIDADDFIIDTALETLFNYAEKYQAEVIYMDCVFICDAEPFPKKISVAAWDMNDIVKKPTFEPEDISLRVEKFLTRRYKWPPWIKFSRRKFLIDNDIKFPRMKVAEDGIWTLELICLAKKLLRIPEPLYAQRRNEISMTRQNRTPEQEIIFRASPFITGIEFLDEFICRQKFFKQNPAFRLQVLRLFANVQFEEIGKIMTYSKPIDIYEIFLREFSKSGSSHPALIAYLLVMNNLYRNELKK